MNNIISISSERLDLTSSSLRIGGDPAHRDECRIYAWPPAGGALAETFPGT